MEGMKGLSRLIDRKDKFSYIAREFDVEIIDWNYRLSIIHQFIGLYYL